MSPSALRVSESVMKIAAVIYVFNSTSSFHLVPKQSCRVERILITPPNVFCLTALQGKYCLILIRARSA